MAVANKEQHAMAAAEKEQQRDFFYCVMAAYVKNKLEDFWEEEDFWEIWLEKGAMIVTRDWLYILDIYGVMTQCCGLSGLFVHDSVLQGDDAKHYLSYAYSRFLDPEVKPNEMYERCVLVMAKLMQNVLEESSVAELVAKFEKLE